MKFERAYLVVFLAFTLCVRVMACPFTIVNDGPIPLMVIDSNGQSAVYIKPGESQIIDPTIQSVWQYVYNEKLDFYVQSGDNIFYKKYQLTEAYCVATKDNRITLSDIEKLVKKSTDRLTVIAYEKPMRSEDQEHSH